MAYFSLLHGLGNVSASSCPWYKQSAEVTHNHPEGIKGAQAIASAIFLTRQHKSKDDIREYIERTFNYNLHRTCDEIRPAYQFDVTCQGSCPEAIIDFLDSHDYESAIRLAISLDGDSDTIACMPGGIAAAYYGIPTWMVKYAVAEYLPKNIRDIIKCLMKCAQRMNYKKEAIFTEMPLF